MSIRPSADKCAVVFPGVGIAPSGSESTFFSSHRGVMEPFLAAAASCCDQDLVAATLDGSWPELPPLAGQLFAHGYNCAVDAVYRQQGVRPALVAGHSLGIYSAMVGAGAVEYGDGLTMVIEAHRFAAQAAAAGPFDMGVVVGLNRAPVQELVERAGEHRLCLASSNSSTSHVLSGHRVSLHEALAEAEHQGALKVVSFDVAVPYHHPVVLRGATEQLRAILSGLDWREPRCPVLSTIDQQLLHDPADLLELTACNLSTPIHWQRAVETMAGQGVQLVWESGPGLSLSQNARFIPGAPRHLSIRQAARRLAQ